MKISGESTATTRRPIEMDAGLAVESRRAKAISRCACRPITLTPGDLLD